MTTLYINGEHCLTLEQLKGYFSQQDLTAKSDTYTDLLEAGKYGDLEQWLQEHNESALAEQVAQVNNDLPDSELFAALKAYILGKNVTPSPSLKPSFDKCFEVIGTDSQLKDDTATIIIQLRVKASYNENYELKIVSSWGTKENTINPSQFKEGNVISLSFTFHKRAGMAWGQCTLFAEGQEIGQVTAANSDILTFNVNKVSFEMIKVEGGTFTMGATSEQGSDAESDETTHSVTLSDYSIGKYEVTQELWQAVMGNNPSSFKGSTKPVESVSWDDCKSFISKLNSLLSSQLGGKRFALPTEAQWEYAARGGKKSQGYKYAGSDNIDDVAWYKNTCGGCAHEVGSKQSNELGLYDMSGNVWEWCQDWYSSSYTSYDTNNPTGPSSGDFRVYRGGSGNDYAGRCRVSFRNSGMPSFRYYCLGFRLVLLP